MNENIISVEYTVFVMCFFFFQSGNDGFVIDPNGRSFMGRIGPDLKLTGKVSFVWREE